LTTDLPIQEILSTVQAQLQAHNTLIVTAPPGAGKSTILPLTIRDAPWLKENKILMLEPRRLATTAIASRMASLLNEQVGNTIGYQIKFDKRVSVNTRIQVITEGILTRMMISDSALEGIGMVIFDEFHERSIHADTALALCREIQQVLRPDLRILIMSATLEMNRLSSLLQAPVVESKGRQYPVEIHYTGARDKSLLPVLTARTVLQAIREKDGDVLVFLPGQAEIKKCEELLQKELPGFSIHPLYGMLPQNRQNAAILPDRQGRRKVVLATSIAETSLTIEGVHIVVDSGYGRMSQFDPGSGLSRLITVAVARDSADQRAGRAGRLGPGVCYRMWTLADHERLEDHRVPEILEADLAPLALDMACWGVEDIGRLTWLDAPPSGALAQAHDLLHQLGALENGNITTHGQQIRQLPCHPRLANLLVLAEAEGSTSLATDVTAILEERDPLSNEAGIDLNTRIEALRRYRTNKGKGGAMGRIERTASGYRKLLHCKPDNGPVDPYETGLMVAHAFPERIACARPGNNAQFQLANGRYAMVGHQDDLAHEPWLAVAHLDARDGLGKIFMAAPINPKDLRPLVKTQEVITWDTRKGGLITSLDLRIGNIVLQSKPLSAPDPEIIISAIIQALRKDGETLLNFSEEVEQWQHRVMGLRSWRPDDHWPNVSTPDLLNTCEKWLPPYLSGLKKNEDLKKLDLKSILQHHLDWDKQEKLNKLAPTAISVPSGSNIKIKYQPNGAPPILAVRLQEVFGLADTPCINDGKTPLLLHLLSPGYKPVQITSDLRSFWNNTYFEVRKDLRGRYPKHAWPDDPWTAEAVRGVRRK